MQLSSILSAFLPQRKQHTLLTNPAHACLHLWSRYFIPGIYVAAARVVVCLLQDINALEQHLQNLITPSTPYFFNTLYDPYREGADFVRGYPFSLREGVPTAISHGLWLNIPDYDAPTQVCAGQQQQHTHAQSGTGLNSLQALCCEKCCAVLCCAVDLPALPCHAVLFACCT